MANQKHLPHVGDLARVFAQHGNQEHCYPYRVVGVSHKRHVIHCRPMRTIIGSPSDLSCQGTVRFEDYPEGEDVGDITVRSNNEPNVSRRLYRVESAKGCHVYFSRDDKA